MSVKIRVPASIANLGPGFDILAMAVDLWLEVDAVPGPRPEWRFEGAEPPPDNPFSGLNMRGRVRSEIPLGVGLGSSAAARVAALRLAGVAEADLLAQAAAAEGHPDNVAAAIHGGLVACVGTRVVHLPPPDLEIALFVSATPTPTEEARRLLPASVPMADAVYSAGRLALLVHALHERDWEMLGWALDDRLHQPARTEIYPWLPDTIAAARRVGAWGAALAGAGPSIFAFCRRGLGEEVAAVMTATTGVAGRPLVTRLALL